LEGYEAGGGLTTTRFAMFFNAPALGTVGAPPAFFIAVALGTVGATTA